MDAVDIFPWSSYREHVSSQSLDRMPLCDASLILRMLDSSAGFHQAKGLEIEILGLVPARAIRSDAEATAIARELSGQIHADSIASLSKVERNASLKQLQAWGASTRQLERLTGIDREIIQASVKERW